MSPTPQTLPKHIHVIGICGVAMSALAIAFHERGVKITGSDKGFFPPVSLELEKHGIPFYAGWHPQKMIENGVPDVIIVGTASGSKNPETIYAKKHGIPMYSYPEVIGKLFAKEKSIVCAGTWGKTSSAALLSFILTQAGLDPTYMFGGVSLSQSSSARLSETGLCVFEGDEYKSSPTDPTAKFFYYKATHLLLTAVSWDHADLYPTEAEYFETFKKLLGTIPPGGIVIACADNAGVMEMMRSFAGKPILYGKKENPAVAYSFSNIAQTKDGLDFTIGHGATEWKIRSPLIGTYQAENITGCFAMAHSLGVEPEKIIEAIASFRGLKRRLEKRPDGDIIVIDDIAHSPEKAASVLETLRSIYSGKILAVFEPNIGGRERNAILKYEYAFKSADTIIVPRLTKLKIDKSATDADRPLEGDELATVISKTHPNVLYIEDDAKLVEYLITTAKKDDVIAFLGSHGFRGMIEEVIAKLPK